MNAQIRIIAGPDNGKVFAIPRTRALVVGRGRETDIQLNDPSVSRLHCEISVEGNEVFVKDLNSRSGIFVEGRRTTHHAVKNFQTVRLGATEFQLEPSELADQATIPAKPIETPEHAGEVPNKNVVRRPRPKSPDVPQYSGELMHNLTGQKLSHFELREVIAKGQSGIVFQALDTDEKRPIALKVLWPDFALDDSEVQRFIRAMKTVLPLRHPNLVCFYSAGKTAKYCWLAMELVEGKSLSQVVELLKTDGKIGWKSALRVAVYVARALEYAHKNQILHRNITPRNILVGRSPEICKLTDLMLAKAMEGKMSEHITKSGQLLGDVHYMSPERTGGSPTGLDERSDIYSLGATLYDVITGQPPFDAPSPIQTILKIRQDPITPPRKLQPLLPADFQTILMKMLAKDPQYRYQSAGQLVQTLEHYAQSEGVEC